MPNDTPDISQILAAVEDLRNGERLTNSWATLSDEDVAALFENR